MEADRLGDEPGQMILDPQYITENANTLKWTYFICAVVCCVLALPMFFYGFKNTKERFTSTEKAPSLGHNLSLLFKNKQLLLIVLSGVLGGARMVYTYTGGLYFAKYVLKNEGLFGIITMLVVPGGLVASILVPWLSKKFTKKWTYVIVHLFGGVVIVENIFAVPGMGSLLVNSVYNRDVMVVQGCMVVMGLVVVVANFLVDISYGLIDPRVRDAKEN